MKSAPAIPEVHFGYPVSPGITTGKKWPVKRKLKAVVVAVVSSLPNCLVLYLLPATNVKDYKLTIRGFVNLRV